MTQHLFCFGLGYSAITLAKQLLPQGWRVSGTCRTTSKCEELRKFGITAYVFSEDLPLQEVWDLGGVTHILHSIPPGENGDPVLLHHLEDLKSLQNLQWVGYLSTTGVYGDHKGEWVTEDTPATPPPGRSQRRLDAENAWLASGLPVHIFRLSGIYGPGRNVIEELKAGTAHRIFKGLTPQLDSGEEDARSFGAQNRSVLGVREDSSTEATSKKPAKIELQGKSKEGQVFSRIHVEDIAQILEASIISPNPWRIYNCADDEPCAQHIVVEYAAELLGIEPPPLVNFEDANLSEMAKSFWANNRRINNNRIKNELKVQLKYPSYKEGLKNI